MITPNSLLEALSKIHILTDEEYKEVKHFSGKVYFWRNNKVETHDLSREDFIKDFDNKIVVEKINKDQDIRKVSCLFHTYDECFVSMYKNSQAKRIDKLQSELKELDVFTQKYNKILEDKPHLGI